ncbi:hypothetical protein, partial [Enterobacter hormaechei]|uniref:hypothetical protein n=1 Tax=Enterobacter hormaechei TaxID=158836 RepID=UPI001ED9A2B7
LYRFAGGGGASVAASNNVRSAINQLDVITMSLLNKGLLFLLLNSSSFAIKVEESIHTETNCQR